MCESLWMATKQGLGGFGIKEGGLDGSGQR